ncbi:hypothetical protein ACQ4M4_17415 [Leptolyngbya sp. AN02str]|uniref:hypothetical protein n=1 Tax=Leptolyngbya sp. AN02str TaxID=3423363 RepID=UPI003D31E513
MEFIAELLQVDGAIPAQQKQRSEQQKQPNLLSRWARIGLLSLIKIYLRITDLYSVQKQHNATNTAKNSPKSSTKNKHLLQNVQENAVYNGFQVV